jgi:hypothetical protein
MHQECAKILRDQELGFDPNNVPNPLAIETLEAEHRRVIHLMKSAVDEVSFDGDELRSKFERNREMKKKYPPSGSERELYGDLQ